MNNKNNDSTADKKPNSPNPDLAEPQDRPAKDHGGEDEMERRNQSLKDTSLGAPVTGFPGTPKPARR